MRLLALLGFVFLALTGTIQAQDTLTKLIARVPVVWTDPVVRARLAKDWSEVAGQNERAYCIRFGRYFNPRAPDNTEFRLTDIWAAQSTDAKPNGITPICPDWPDIVILHTHPPHSHATALTDTMPDNSPEYIPGGWEAYECFPSDNDYSWFLGGQRAFALIQCDKNSIVPFFREPYSIFVAHVVHVPYFVPDTIKINLEAAKYKSFWYRLRHLF